MLHLKREIYIYNYLHNHTQKLTVQFQKKIFLQFERSFFWVQKMVNFCFLIHSLKMVEIPVSFWDGLFSGAILVSGSARQTAFSVVFSRGQSVGTHPLRFNHLGNHGLSERTLLSLGILPVGKRDSIYWTCIYFWACLFRTYLGNNCFDSFVANISMIFADMSLGELFSCRSRYQGYKNR